MGTDVAEVEETPYNSIEIKVHRDMCTQLLILVDRVSKLFPAIEAAQPRCSSGIQALCLFQNAIEKAQGLVQQCSVSSKLYLAITGEAIVSRCHRTKNLLEQSLRELQTMVPVALEFEISQTIEYIRHVGFTMDSSEEEVGKAIRTLLKQDKSVSESTEGSEVAAVQLAASTLHLTSRKDLLIEKRSIKMLLDKVTDSDKTKRSILKYLLYLLKKYETIIVGKQAEDSSLWRDKSFSVTEPDEKPMKSRVLQVESCLGNSENEVQPDILRGLTPPEEFKCPISLALMYDPVVIASGQTFERAYIQKWFDEDHDTCPRTRMKLDHFLLMPNTSMKIIISKWCKEHGITITDPNVQQSVFPTSESSSNSISSSVSSLKDLHLQIDLSKQSLGSFDESCSSGSFHSQTGDGLKLVKVQPSESFLFFSSVHDVEREFLSNISALPWKSQCMVIADVKTYLERYSQACVSTSSDNFLEPLLGFLNITVDKCDTEAQKNGAQLLLAYLRTIRRRIPSISQDMYDVLASFLETEAAAEETLTILELLSVQEKCGSRLAESGAFASILKMFDTENTELKEAAVKILENLSSRANALSDDMLHECIPKLVPLLSNSSLAGRCITILKNLCHHEAVRISVTETEGCVASIAELLDNGSFEEQEHAVYILLSLCSQHLRYCQLVMEEGVIPALVSLAINGNDKGKIMAEELLRILRDVADEEPNMDHVDIASSNATYNHLPNDNTDSRCGPTQEKKLRSRTGFFGRKMRFFSKPSSISPRKKK
ncbi:hypothetical protein Dimus_014195 [Dionaea muscipula]